jgi:hypothetical protein
MIDVWNEVMAGSPIPQATMTARRAGALPRIMSHHFLKGRLHAWCRYLDCVVKDRMLRGERPGGHPTTIDQVATVGMIERVDAMRAARRYDHGIEGAEEPEILRHPDEPEMVAGVLFDKNGKAAGPDPEENRRINDTLAMALEQMRLSGNLVES